MELTIDGRACDLGAARCVVPGYDAARLADPAAAREGRSLRIELPATPRNDAATGFARDPHAFERFNDARHRAAVTAAGLLWGWGCMAVVMLFWNYLITPVYMGCSREEIAKLLLPVFLPFNLLKGGLNGAITLLLYRPVVKPAAERF